MRSQYLSMPPSLALAIAETKFTCSKLSPIKSYTCSGASQDGYAPEKLVRLMSLS